MAAVACPLGSDVSPNKPTLEPDDPSEVAHQLTSEDTTQLALVSNDPEMAATGIEGAGPSSAPESPSCSTADTDLSSDLGCVPLDGLITESMLKEEKELHLKSKEEEKRLKEESINAWQKEQDDQRYKRLQHLLEKSSIYSTFLLNKMEEQQKQEKLRQEKRAKKLRKKQEEEEKKRKEAEKEAGKDEEKENKESKGAGSGPASRRSGRSKRQELVGQDVPGTSGSQDQDSSPSTDSQNLSSDQDKPNTDQVSLGKTVASHSGKAIRKSSQDSDSSQGTPKQCAIDTGPKSSGAKPSEVDPRSEESPSLEREKLEHGSPAGLRHSHRKTRTVVEDNSVTEQVDTVPLESEPKCKKGSEVGSVEQASPTCGLGVNSPRKKKRKAGKESSKLDKAQAEEEQWNISSEVDSSKEVVPSAQSSPRKEVSKVTDSLEQDSKSGSTDEQGRTEKSADSSETDSRAAEKNTACKASAGSNQQSSRSKGRKRMREDYTIADYIDKSTLTSKKVKLDTEETERAGKQEQDHRPPSVKSDNSPDDQPDASQESSVGADDVKSQEVASPPAPAKQEEEFVDTFSRTINGEKISDLQPDLFTGGRLRQYQVEGIEWLKVLYENGVNGILGDEMGLGKTVQCIGLFAHIIKMGVPGPFLVVAPLSTLSNWMSEFQRFTPTIKVLLYHGSPEERQKLRRQIRKQYGEYKTHPVVVTSYEIVMIDRKHLSNHLWKYIIVDEGHRIKNLNCRLIRELKMYHSANRVLLTGTPLQNNLSELWSMLNFLLPEVFDDLKTFESWFDFSTLIKQGGDEAIVAKEREKHIVSMLHQILSPFLLRRLKADVELKVPPKKEILVQAPLTAQQEELYKALVDKTILGKMQEKHAQPLVEETVELTPSGRTKRRCRAEVDYALMGDNNDTGKGDVENWFQKLAENAERCQKASQKDSTADRPKDVELNIKIKNIMSQLRKACNHPYLLEYPLDPTTQEYRVDEDLVSSSGKFMVLERLLPALKKQNHKILIFSQMTRMLDILEDYCHLRKHQYCRLDGTMKYIDRQQQIDDFNTDPDIFVFLLSTRAGGLGINLTAADTVIIFDSDWNPQSDLQAQDRCHRIGQTKPVVIYRLVTSNTIDQKIVERAAAKRRLEKMVIHQGKFKGGKSNLVKDSQSLINPTELLELLRSCDHSGFVKNCNRKVISDEDLALLLDRSDLLAKFKGKKSAPTGSRKRGKVAGGSGVFKVLDDGTEGDSAELRIGT